MSDVRLLPRLPARATGIPRSSTQVPQRQPTDTATSHVSASPAAGAQAQAQVRAARRPPGMRQDVRVQILDRRSAAPTAGPAPLPTAVGPASAGSQFPTVQLVERPRAPGAAGATSPFTVEQMMLIGHLLDRYVENTLAIQDTANAALAEGALVVLSGLSAEPSAQPPQDSAQTPLATPTRAVVVAPSPTVSVAEADDANGPSRSRRRPRGRGAGGDVSAPPEGTTPAGPPSSPEGASSSSKGEPSTPAVPDAVPEKT